MFYYLTSIISFCKTDWLQRDIVFLVGMRWYIGCWRLNHDYERSYPLNSLERNFWSDCFLQLRKVKKLNSMKLEMSMFYLNIDFEYNCGVFEKNVEDSCFVQGMLFVSFCISILFGSELIYSKGVQDNFAHNYSKFL